MTRRLIEQLSPDVIEILAASEAVDRPVSVVKEVVENAIDAGATEIEISMRSGGQDGLKIRDNGRGMNADDLSVSWMRHYSSKTKTTGEAIHPRNIGFRGEALYAISRAADVAITSRTAACDHAHTISIVNGVPADQPTPARGPLGTEISIGYLFARIPARRAQLGTPRSDVARVKTYVQRVAVLHPEISFRLTDEKAKTHVEVFEASSLADRCSDVLGQDFIDQATQVDVQFDVGDEAWTFSGFITPLQPGARASERNKVCQVGQFLVSAPEVEQAIKRVWRSLYSIGNREFAYVLSLSPALETRNVNYNAHPQKRSVVFRDGSGFQAALEQAIIAELSSSDGGGALQHAVEGGMGMIGGEAVDLAAECGPLGRPIGQYRNGFILSEAKDGLIIIDQHAAHEKILMERMLQRNENPDFSSHRLRQPILLADDVATQVRLEEIEPELMHLGIELSHEDGETYLVSAPVLNGASLDPSALVRALSDQVPSADVIRRLAYDLANKACKQAIKNGTKLTMDQMFSFLRLMEAWPRSATCNHGRPTIHRVSHEGLLGLFDRAA
ncbi:DNA mismatch repair endonuclease MutL [Salipiger sp. PrR003]|uniref:DNA mismatch repair endonuclease MutL n=1 Tax=Salipiger sp. PrR003 TaxID=2706776 RepID=UPI0013D9658B|nr:DNA mismatch repair endonuclease MutL [Salipiger sp. PrR003]NDV52860.1 hypothetical protein [Salipiger sp. PrR003]